MILGGNDGEKGKGFPSHGIFFIRLDRKGRLVLPLEIREAIGIETDGRILLSASDDGSGQILIRLAKAPEDADSCAYSRNGSYMRKNGGVNYGNR